MTGLLIAVLLATVCSVLAVPSGRQASSDVHHYHHYYSTVTNDYGPETKQVRQDATSANKTETPENHRVWRFQIGHDIVGAYSFIDDHGYLKGAYIDIISTVCKQAGRACSYSLDEFRRCWAAEGDHETPGYALVSGAYDACMGYTPTPARLNSFNFTEPFSPNPKANLYFRAGEAPEGDLKNVTGYTFGFVNGWMMNAKCLRSQLELMGDFEAKFFASRVELLKALKNKEVDAILAADIFESSNTEVVSAGPTFKCSLGGLSVMSRYGDELIDWWNDAYEQVAKQLCDKVTVKYADHGKLHC